MSLSSKMKNKDEFILIINTAINHYLGVAILKNKELLARSWRKVQYKQSESLLAFIDTVLVKNGLRKEDLSGIVVVAGPGSFTAVRIGVLTANTWGLLLDLPVISYEIKNKELLEKKDWNLADWRHLLIDIKNQLENRPLGGEFQPVLPIYNAKPNVGK